MLKYCVTAVLVCRLARPQARWYQLRGLPLVGSECVCPQCTCSFVIARGSDMPSAMDLPVRITRSQELTTNANNDNGTPWVSYKMHPTILCTIKCLMIRPQRYIRYTQNTLLACLCRWAIKKKPALETRRKKNIKDSRTYAHGSSWRNTYLLFLPVGLCSHTLLSDRRHVRVAGCTAFTALCRAAFRLLSAVITVHGKTHAPVEIHHLFFLESSL